MLWIVFVLMTLAALAFVALPLVRRRSQDISRDAYSLEVYRHQLAELENDVERGVLTADEQTGARLEIERRMLALSSAPVESDADKPAPWPEVAALVVAFAAGAFGIYLTLGAPELPDRPFASRPVVDPTVTTQQPGNMAEAIRRLTERLEKEPGNIEGWMLLGQSYVATKKYDDAADAFRSATEIDPGDPQILLALGESLALGADGAVIPAAQAAFDKALEISPEHVGARFYTAEGLDQKGRSREAFDIWLKIVGDTPADAPWLSALMQRLEATAKKLDIELASVLPKTLPPMGRPEAATTDSAPGPDQADIAAAQDMSGEDRAAMIRSMVERLATRLKDNPDDVEGWRRLARAYQVLGETTKAAEVRARVKELTSEPQKSGPTQEDVAAAKDMSSEDRKAMIGSMVGRLEARLKSSPDDFEGWMMLARSYGALKSPARAQSALRQALRLRGDDINVQMQLASNIIEASDRTRPLPDEAVDLFESVLTLAPDNMDALYFTGLAAAQRQNLSGARARWNSLLRLLPAGGEAYATVKRQLDELEK